VSRRRGETVEQATIRREAKFWLLYYAGFGRFGVCSTCGKLGEVAGRRRRSLKCEACIDRLADPPGLARAVDARRVAVR
jgi:hypothetical protein